MYPLSFQMGPILYKLTLDSLLNGLQCGILMKYVKVTNQQSGRLMFSPYSVARLKNTLFTTQMYAVSKSKQLLALNLDVLMHF